MVNAKFPDRAGYGFEMVDVRESRSAITQNRHHSKFHDRLRQFFRKCCAN
jgi:hypothetical protein